MSGSSPRVVVLSTDYVLLLYVKGSTGITSCLFTPLAIFAASYVLSNYMYVLYAVVRSKVCAEKLEHINLPCDFCQESFSWKALQV